MIAIQQDGRRISARERSTIVKRLRPELAGYHANPLTYDFDGFHHSWSEKLHAMGCAMAVFRQLPIAYTEKHYASIVGTAVAHWATPWAFESERWRPPRQLLAAEWDDLVTISHELGVRGMGELRAYYLTGGGAQPEEARLCAEIKRLRGVLDETQEKLRRGDERLEKEITALKIWRCDSYDAGVCTADVDDALERAKAEVLTIVIRGGSSAPKPDVGDAKEH